MAEEGRHGGGVQVWSCSGLFDKVGRDLNFDAVGPLTRAPLIGRDAATRPSDLDWNLGWAHVEQRHEMNHDK